MGTVVGAGFATGKEILEFFTRYGWTAVFTIAAATALFVWLGIRLMLLSGRIGARSYEDLNKTLFGDRAGGWISLFTLIMLFGVTTVMLAGGGSLFEEHLRLSYQIGLFLTLILTYLLLEKGMSNILIVNSIVVPGMLVFVGLVVWATYRLPSAGNWIMLTSDYAPVKIAFAPVLYAAYNLAMAQAVLVPLGSEIRDKHTLYWGGLLGGLGIGGMLVACHFALSAQMPGVARYDIPMGHLIAPLGRAVQLAYVMVIFGEIFTTFLSNVYGLTLQLQQRTGIRRKVLETAVLAGCYGLSQLGFGRLLSFLYPLFGLVSVVWFVMVIWSPKARDVRSP